MAQQQPKLKNRQSTRDITSQKSFTSEKLIVNNNNYPTKKKIIWLTLGLGWIPTILYGVVSLFWFVFLSFPFLPFGLQIFRIFKFMQFPFSLSEREFSLFSSVTPEATTRARFFFQRYYDPKLIQLLFSRDKTSTFIQCANIVWFLCFGWWICCCHILCGLALFMTIIGKPYAKRHFTLLYLSSRPFGTFIKV